VIEHQIKDDVNPTPVGFANQEIEILQSSETRIDRVIIAYVIAEIDIWGRINRGKPNGVDPEVR
jgi:hypothetical protein